MASLNLLAKYMKLLEFTKLIDNKEIVSFTSNIKQADYISILN